MEKVDLFNTLVRFLAVKPLVFEEFDIQKAEAVIKSEKRASISFMGDHHYFEEVIDKAAKQVGEQKSKNGTVYLFVRGRACTERMKRNILDLILSVRTIVIFGNEQDWPITDPKIRFVSPDNIFSDNHQRFFVYQSAGFNVCLVSRHNESDQVEAAMSNDPEATSLISQTIGTRIFNQ